MTNLDQVKLEIKELGKSPFTERMYPIASDWVPVTDVLAIIERFEKYWKQSENSKRSTEERKLISEILGKT
jgi:hypothetical protein